MNLVLSVTINSSVDSTFPFSLKFTSVRQSVLPVVQNLGLHTFCLISQQGFLVLLRSNTVVFAPFCMEYTKDTPAHPQISYGSLKCSPSFCIAVLEFSISIPRRG